jgi:hypothetical protein
MLATASRFASANINPLIILAKFFWGILQNFSSSICRSKKLSEYQH